MKKFKKSLVVLLAVVAVVGASLTAYAAVGAQSVSKVGDKYVVETVLTETMDGNTLVQTVEKRWIPEAEYEAVAKMAQLRAAIDHALDVDGYVDNRPGTSAHAYQWKVTTAETAASNTEVGRKVTFKCTASSQGWQAEFIAYASFDSKGNPVVKYYLLNNGQIQKDSAGNPIAYGAASINQMLEQYGVRR